MRRERWPGKLIAAAAFWAALHLCAAVLRLFSLDLSVFHYTALQLLEALLTLLYTGSVLAVDRVLFTTRHQTAVVLWRRYWLICTVLFAAGFATPFATLLFFGTLIGLPTGCLLPAGPLGGILSFFFVITDIYSAMWYFIGFLALFSLAQWLYARWLSKRMAREQGLEADRGRSDV